MTKTKQELEGRSWHVGSIEKGCVTVFSPGGPVLVRNLTPEDAQLIAAAPALLEALKEITAQLECPCRNTTATSYRRDGSVIISSDVREQCKAAIARAEAKPA